MRLTEAAGVLGFMVTAVFFALVCLAVLHVPVLWFEFGLQASDMLTGVYTKLGQSFLGFLRLWVIKSLTLTAECASSLTHNSTAL